MHRVHGVNLWILGAVPNRTNPNFFTETYGTYAEEVANSSLGKEIEEQWEEGYCFKKRKFISNIHCAS